MKKTGQRGPTIQIGIRIPQPLHQRLTEIATVEHRSLNEQIIHLLETSSHFFPAGEKSLLEIQMNAARTRPGPLDPRSAGG